MTDRRKKALSRVATVLVLFGLATVFAIVTVLLYAPPSSPKEFAVLTAIVTVGNAIWLAVVLLWERFTEKRRRDRLGG